MKTENERLFSEFPPVTVEEWEKKILEDLKGADYEKKLTWVSPEGIKIKPYYTSEDIESLKTKTHLPGEFPYLRHTLKKGNSWKATEFISATSFVAANEKALKAIRQGADAIGFDVKGLKNLKEMSELLKDIDLSSIEVHFVSSHSYPETFDLFLSYLESRNIDKKTVRGSFNFDPFSYLLLHGNFYTTQENNFVEAKYLVESVKRHLPGFSTITVNAHYFHDAGANAVQELAFALSAATEYVSGLTDKGIDAEVALRSIKFSFGIGSNFFMEIAKLRAARYLWSLIAQQFCPNDKEVAAMKIQSVTSALNKTVYDAHTNMLRVTTEAMSAVLGGASYVLVRPFDFAFKNADDFSSRIAMNVNNILRYEAYFDKVCDPAAGSYYIETLTSAIAEEAWKLFQSIENEGGFLKNVLNNNIQTQIEATLSKRQKDTETRKQVILGVNQYPNLNESITDKINPDTIFWKSDYTNEKNVIIKKLEIQRLATPYEQLRLATELFVKKGNKRPKVFLFTYGNLAMRKARAMFTTNFFGCAGYIIHDNPGFANIEEGVEAFLKSSSEIVVLCSSDDEYATLAAQATRAIKEKQPQAIVVVAGNPTAIIDELKAAGVDDFIHIRSNVLETLQQFNKKLGIQ